MVLLILLSLLLSLAVADQGCPPGAFISFSGDKCYQPVFLPTDFHSAEKLCVEFGGHLASVHSKWENAGLMVSVQLDNYWLGGQHVNSNGSWTWTDGSAFNYNNWASGGGVTGKDCLLVDRVTTLWQPSDCQRKATFICETKLSSTTTTLPTTTVPTTTPPSTTTMIGPPCTNCTCTGGHCYVFVECYLTWDDALSNCKRMKGNLASVHNAHVEAIIEQHASKLGRWYWIGGQCDENKHINWSDGTSVDYTHWATEEPYENYGDYRCVRTLRRRLTLTIAI
uniref:C-type lectin domain-containing protein n=1 Tax=Steinernema glaseri TaxID=37863 RepID=A0A1I8AAQ3_9BILA